MPSKRSRRQRRKRKQQAKAAENPPVTLEPYRYRELPNKSSIRVLELLPSPEGEIACTLITADLDDNPTFDALSYSWANPITIRERPIPSGKEGKELRQQLMAKHIKLSEGSPGILHLDPSIMFYLMGNNALPYMDVEHGRDLCRQINCDGKAIKVTETLYSALEDSRATLMSKLDAELQGKIYLETLPVPRSRHIWIDAICINQNDIDERNEQVPLMNRIFACAQYVFAWIGELDTLGASGFDAMWDMEYSLPRQTEWKATDKDNIEQVCAKRNKDQYAMAALLCRLWFRRAWVVQEAVYARRLYLWCGHTFVDWWYMVHATSIIIKEDAVSDMVELMASLLRRAPASQLARKLMLFEIRNGGKHSETPPITEEELFNIVEGSISFIRGVVDIKKRLALPTYRTDRRKENIEGIKMALSSQQGIEHHWTLGPLSEPFSSAPFDRNEDHSEDQVQINMAYINHEFELAAPSPPTPISLFSLITGFRDVGASDPRDKVFAFLHLATELPNLKANYRTTPQYIFEATAKIILNLGLSDLALLSHIQDSADTVVSGLPSWVPDFSVPLKRKAFVEDNESCLYSANGTALLQPKFWLTVADEKRVYEVLSLTGYHLDTIAAVTESHGCYFTRVGELALQTPRVYSKSMSLQYIKKANMLMRLGSEETIRPDHVSRVEALWRTLIADSYDDTYPAPVTLGFGFSEWVAAHIHHSTHLSGQIQSLIDKEKNDKVIEDLETFQNSQHRKRKVWEQLDSGESGFYICHECASEHFDQNISDHTFTKELSKYSLTPSMHPGRYLPDSFRMLALMQCFYARGGQQRAAESFACPDFTPAEKGRERQFRKRMREVKKGRKMFRTSRNLLGMGPKSVQPGDEVWILPSAKVPFVLRPVDSGKAPKRFTLVGEAYVHGYMDGEILQEKPEIQAFGII